MKKINVLFFSLAIVTVVCMMLIGIAIAIGSLIGIILASLATILVMGFSFSMKKKMRNSGRL
ncbi:DUF5325 family protein [Calidifontibacillus oryziterrae]|uniref:DUF5325 family protein n=1 Tax=Calidifontibacillus oryziterrae TaxID=1191699 RepID=UPI0002F4CEDF|nr:DUF5325 family protein [Calidifontibacillus oryziterrae]